MTRFVILVAAIGVLATDTGRCHADEIPGAQPQFKIITKWTTDKVEVQIENDKTVFAIRSTFGISNAVIKRTDEKWPECMVLRMHLKGLESFQAMSGTRSGAGRTKQ